MRILHVGFGFRPLRWGGLIAYAEDLMEAQARRGHHVGYFFAGRVYPFMSRPRLKRWKRRGVAMFEVVNTTLPVGGGWGTPAPDLDLDHPPTEAMFARTLRDFRPDVVHVQEMLGLPSSLFGIAHDHGIPSLMTLEDYGLLCPTLKLYDADGSVCERLAPGEMCSVCCRHAPATQQGMVDATTFYEQTRFLDRTGLKVIPRPQAAVNAVRGLGGWSQEVFRRLAPDKQPVHIEPASAGRGNAAEPEAYDRRRATNVERLSRVDLLLAMSHRVAEVYAARGVDPARLRVLHLTLEHLDHIPGRTLPPVQPPVRFATLAGLASREKGTDVVLGALEMLQERGYTERDFTLTAKGYLEERAKDRLAALPMAEWDGFYGPEHMQHLFEPWHVGIVPSTWEECYGYVGVEFLAAGLPVIGNAIGGIPDYTVDGETGWLNRDRSAEGLAAIMEDIIRRPEQVNALNHRIVARRHELVKPLSAHVEEMDGVYTALVSGQVRAVPAVT